MKEGSITRPRNAEYFWRAAAATVRGFVEGIPAEDAARARHADDPVTPIIIRGTSTQATTTDPTWAGPLAQLSISAAIQEAVSMSAVGDLIARGAFKIELGRNASVRAPGRAINPADAGVWVPEGKPIPARILSFLSGPLIVPRKVAVIVTMTQQLIEASNIEDIVRVMLSEAAGLALDAAVFGTAAAAGGQPGGILNGVTPVVATTGGGFDAVGQDLGNLVADIASRGGGRNAFFVASPSEATAIRFYAGGQFSNEGDNPLPVASSAALADGTVVCIEPSSLAISVDDPQFAAAKETAVHQEDTTPAENLMTGSPVKSMFQIDATALKMTLWADWGMRAPHVSYLTGATW
jgi:HK97 family phage major capsid protein